MVCLSHCVYDPHNFFYSLFLTHCIYLVGIILTHEINRLFIYKLLAGEDLRMYSTLFFVFVI